MNGLFRLTVLIACFLGSCNVLIGTTSNVGCNSGCQCESECISIQGTVCIQECDGYKGSTGEEESTPSRAHHDLAVVSWNHNRSGPTLSRLTGGRYRTELLGRSRARNSLWRISLRPLTTCAYSYRYAASGRLALRPFARLSNPPWLRRPTCYCVPAV